MNENCYTICPQCDKITAARVKFCTRCGKALAPTPIPKTPMTQGGPDYQKICPACKKIFDATEDFCGFCGEALMFCSCDPRFETFVRDPSRDNVKQEANPDNER